MPMPTSVLRARHGLDVVRELQALDSVDVQLFQDGSKAEEGVDERLLNLAKSMVVQYARLTITLTK